MSVMLAGSGTTNTLVSARCTTPLEIEPRNSRIQALRRWLPTTMALVDSSQALVVNSQFDAGENPEPPFTVSLIQIPALPVAAEATPEA